MTDSASTVIKLPNALIWLADAPLFIDEKQVDRFYDAVVRPLGKEGTTTLSITEETASQIKGKLDLEAGLSVGALGAILTSFLKPEAKVRAGGEYQRGTNEQESTTVELIPIDTPQRQLEQLTIHYLINYQNRLFLPKRPSEEAWRDSQTISEVPRELVFFDLPGQDEARRDDLPETKLIPTAAEFADGTIELLYSKLGTQDEEPPPYPEDPALSPDGLRAERKRYWQWFDEHFKATQAIRTVEEAAGKHGRIRWIDYRVPLTNNGDTLHLHISPAENYDTGVFAYNFIKRGFKHGLRLVGTLKSEPDMNVLAIYDK